MQEESYQPFKETKRPISKNRTNHEVHELKLSDCEDEAPDLYKDSINEPLNIDPHQNRHSELLILGKAINADQIEALDQNILEMSLLSKT